MPAEAFPYPVPAVPAPPSAATPALPAPSAPAVPGSVGPSATPTPAAPVGILPSSTPVSTVTLSAAQAALDAKITTLTNAVPLGVANPRTAPGVAADVNIVGAATDGSRWVKVGAGATAWEQIMISTNGEFAANVALATVATNQVPADGVLGRFRGVPTIGDSATVRGQVLPMGLCKYLSAPMANITASPVDFLTFSVKSGIVYQFRFGGAATNVKSASSTLSANLSVYSETAFPIEMSRDTGAFDPGIYAADPNVYGTGGDALFHVTDLEANIVGLFYSGDLGTNHIKFGGEVLIRATADGSVSLRCTPYSSPVVRIEQGSYAILTPLAFVE